jgi:hypothetical protein
MNNRITAYNTPFGPIAGRYLSDNYTLFIRSFVPRGRDFLLTVTNGMQFHIFRDVFDECVDKGKVPSRLIRYFKDDLGDPKDEEGLRGGPDRGGRRSRR